MSVFDVFVTYTYYGALLIGAPVFISYLIYQFFYKPLFIRKLKAWGLNPKDNPFK